MGSIGAKLRTALLFSIRSDWPTGFSLDWEFVGIQHVYTVSSGVTGLCSVANAISSATVSVGAADTPLAILK